ncbi:MAG: hypothetical protein GX119_08450, partial [Syntrophomonadaceae bacterium]|nr:hypothetical protein [Syntrophomonadaceae bacterium]
TGDGVEKTVEFSLAELEALPQAKYTYSGYNHWPSLQIFEDMQGPTLKTILDQAGLKDNATLIRVKVNDAVYFEFTKDQLLEEPRYYFPEGENEENLSIWPPVRSEKGKKPVETMIALNKNHGKLLYGQCAINEPTCCMNRQLSGLYQGGTIEVLTTPLQQWDAPQPDVAPGTVPAGTQVTIQYKDGTPYHALVYYTLDGSEPGYGSKIANISYPSFQPELNKAITIDKSLTIKTRTIGMGKLDSQVATYEYLVAGSTPSSSWSRQFVDLQNHPARDDVYALVDKGIINGMSATEFQPEGKLTRAQIAKLLTTALQLTPEQGKTLSFTDVLVSSWYYNPVAAGVQAGLINGYNASTFAPDDYVNHEQLAVMIARALKKEPGISAGDAEKILNQFSDKEKISSWAKQDIAVLANCGIVDAADGSSFKPQVSATRAEAAVMIADMCRELNLL